MSVPDWVSLTADVCSVVSLGATTFLAWQTFSIKQSIVDQTRIPEAKADLEKLAASLLPLLDKWPRFENEAYAHLAKISGVLSTLHPRLKGQSANQARELLAKMHGSSGLKLLWVANSDAEKLDKIWEINERLEGVIEILRQITKDYRRRI